MPSVKSTGLSNPLPPSPKGYGGTGRDLVKKSERNRVFSHGVFWTKVQIPVDC